MCKERAVLLAIFILAFAGAVNWVPSVSQGQGQGTLVAVAGPTASLYAVDHAGTIYRAFGGPPWEPVAQSPGSSAPIGLSNSEFGGDYYIALEDGDVYRFYGVDHPNYEFTYLGNVFAGDPVQNTQTTWGRVKAERR